MSLCHFLYNRYSFFRINEILNYDEESFIGVIYLASYFVKNVLSKGNEEDNNIFNENNSIWEDEEINTEQKNNFKKINDVALRYRKLNLDLINPGCLPELDKKIEEYKKAENVVDESSLKVDLMEKQINFINKYIGQIKKNKNV